MLDTTVSTIELPRLSFTLLITLLSFLVITSGFVFCYVNGMPMVGMTRDQHGNYKSMWISNQGMSSQFLAEGLVAAMAYTCGACSLIAAVYELEKDEADKTEVDNFLEMFAYTSPIWGILAFFVFNMKIPQYVPVFFPPTR
jgi:hypothetical protein